MLQFSEIIDSEIKKLLRPKIGRHSRFTAGKWIVIFQSSRFTCPKCHANKPASELILCLPVPPYRIERLGPERLRRLKITYFYDLSCTECSKLNLSESPGQKHLTSNLLDMWKKRQEECQKVIQKKKQ